MRTKLTSQLHLGSLVLFASASLFFIVAPENFFGDLPFDLCLFRILFHRDCWGCGTLRGLSHFFHGHFLATWQSNHLIYLWLIFVASAEIYLVVRAFFDVKFSLHHQSSLTKAHDD